MIKIVKISLLIIFLATQAAQSQTLHLPKRMKNAVGGKAFAISISDSTLSLQKREELIFKEIKKGNVPEFLRNLTRYQINFGYNDKKLVGYFLPDYFAIGNNADFIYIPMTPMLAQKVANLTKCILPTKSMVDLIYTFSTIRLKPQPILPSKAMTTVPVFIAHTDSVLKQLQPFLIEHNNGAATAGNKKDIIISNKIYGETTPRVVIYGWHKLDKNAIQPVYNKHANTWADYSHGIRLVQNEIYVNGKKTTIKKILANKDSELLFIFSTDEGVIKKPYYPTTGY